MTKFKPKLTLWTLIALCCVALIAALIVYNNRAELFPKQSDPIDLAPDSAELILQEESAEDSLLVAEAEKSFILASVSQQLRSSPPVSVTVSVEFFFESDSLQYEFLLKRNAVRTLLRTILSTQSVDQLSAVTLRTEILQQVNSLMDKGQVSEVLFRQFEFSRPEE